MNYKEAVNYIYGLRKFGKDTGRIRASRALKVLGNPQRRLNVIHVAGTNGKGSVCAFINSVLIKLGYNVGMFTSPHLVIVNERIRINGIMISNEEFLQLFNKVYKVSATIEDSGEEGLAFFDFVYVMAVLYFDKMKVDYVVMETGLGGENDATVTLNPKLMSIITSISLDHTEILGDTLGKIAKEKAGIISDYTPVVYWDGGNEISQVLEKRAGDCHSKSYFVNEKSFKISKIDRKYIDFSVENSYYEKSMFSIKGACLYQVMNATLALEAISHLSDKKNWSLELIRQAIWETVWEGRMEEVSSNVYVDGAHNPDGIVRLIESVKLMKNETDKIYLLFGAVCEKDYSHMIEALCCSGIFDGFVITQINNSRKLKADLIYQEFCKYTDKTVILEADNKEAFQKAKNLLGEGDFLICAGSLYLVGVIKEMLGE